MPEYQPAVVERGDVVRIERQQVGEVFQRQLRLAATERRPALLQQSLHLSGHREMS
jgi:hypothetical protein